MSTIDSKLFDERKEEKRILSLNVFETHKKMYDWLRQEYRDSKVDVHGEMVKAAIAKLMEINAKAPRKFEEAG